MKVVITGGAGFVGGNLVRTICTTEPTWRVAVVDDLSTGARSNLDGATDIELHEASILDEPAMLRALTDADAVVHLAARPSVARSVAEPLRSHETNATGTVRVLEAARRTGVRHVVVASSSSVYGATRQLPKHEDLPTRPLSPYAVSKLACESYALAFSHCYDLPALAFRFFNVFGPLQPAGHAYAAAIPAFISAAAQGRPITIFGDGLQTRDFTYVDSLCAVVVDALRRRVASDEPVNLAFGTRRTLLSVVDELSALWGRRLDRVHTDPRPGDVRDSQADQSRLRELFPDIQPVDFAVGLKATADWHLKDAVASPLAASSEAGRPD